MASEIKIGDWVRFYSSGTLVIGVVEYRESRTAVGDRICTNIGYVDEGCVLEVRKAVIDAEPEDAPIHDPAYCRSPTDVLYKGDPNTKELLTAELVHVERRTEVLVVPKPLA